jgi:hypothetical protein
MLNVVVARYKEDVAWLNRLPSDCKVYLYNKGPDLQPGVLHRDVTLIRLPNHGRESGTYLHHLMERFRADEGDFTVFTQGGPFEHAPAMLELMRVPHQWRDVQPLSVRWVAEKNIPPPTLTDHDRRDWIGELPVRTEHFSLTSWAPLGFFDRGAWGIGATYREKHHLSDGVNIAQHFFELCRLDDIAERAASGDVGVFSYGAIFAVRNQRIADFMSRHAGQLDRMELLSRADMNYGYIYERCWLHLFGEPFIRFDALRRPEASQQPAPTLRPQPVAQPRFETPAEATRVPELRRQAYEALGKGLGDAAVAILKKALLHDPMDVEVLSDLAVLGFQQRQYGAAIPYARRALAVNPSHTASVFTLAMSLAAQGEHGQAVPLLQSLTGGAHAAKLRSETPELADVAQHELARIQALLQPAA